MGAFLSREGVQTTPQRKGGARFPQAPRPSDHPRTGDSPYREAVSFNLAFAASVPTLGRQDPASLRGPGACLLAATVMLPAGFLLGGLVVYGGDPGFAIVLVPMGAVLLLAGLFRLWRLSGGV